MVFMKKIFSPLPSLLFQHTNVLVIGFSAVAHSSAYLKDGSVMVRKTVKMARMRMDAALMESAVSK